MELTSVKKALEFLKKQSETNKPEKVTINSDSNLIISTITLHWKKKANLDLWGDIEKLLIETSNIHIQWRWVKAHAGEISNEIVDMAARGEAEKIQKKK